MTEYEMTQLVFSGVGTVAVVGTLIGLVIQLRIQGRAVARQAAGQWYEVYQRLCDNYSDLLWKATDDPTLNAIWEPLRDDRAAALTAAQQNKNWGAWYAMDAEEKKAYRYTRMALEIFEQAFEIWQLGWVASDVWGKWMGWITIWSKSRFFHFVYEDTKPRITKDFAIFLESEAINL